MCDPKYICLNIASTLAAGCIRSGAFTKCLYPGYVSTAWHWQLVAQTYASEPSWQ